MKLPKKINVLGTDYKIHQTSDVSLFHPDRATGGLSDVEGKNIFIDPGLSRKDFWMTFLHELKHAHQYESGLFQAMSEDIMEVDAETTARMLFNLFHLRFIVPHNK